MYKRRMNTRRNKDRRHRIHSANGVRNRGSSPKNIVKTLAEVLSNQAAPHYPHQRLKKTHAFMTNINDHSDFPSSVGSTTFECEGKESGDHRVRFERPEVGPLKEAMGRKDEGLIWRKRTPRWCKKSMPAKSGLNPLGVSSIK